LDSSLAARAVRVGLREVVAGKLAAAVIVRAGRLGLGLAAAIGLAAAVQGAEQAVMSAANPAVATRGSPSSAA
jgi:hypothetical protein